MDNEFLLQDRLQKIRQIITKYGEENFYISYSGGKDSNVLSSLIDEALPDNKIPRVYANTGIEYNLVVDFVKQKAAKDERFVIIQPHTPIKKMLEEKGYPFKSKRHSDYVEQYQRHPERMQGNWEKMICVKNYLGLGKQWTQRNKCPQILLYQFTEQNNLKISSKCCDKLKKEPLKQYMVLNKKAFCITGLMRAEEGRRKTAQCLVFQHNKLKIFQPLAPISKEWEEWYIKKNDIQLPLLYYPPYNFKRTGCKGCPYAIDLQNILDIMQEYFPNEKKQCERIWAPVYAEYRRLGYRLRKQEKQLEGQVSFFDKGE